MDDVIITSVHKESDSESQVSDNDEVMTTGAPELDEDSDVDMDEGMMEALAYGAGEVILRILNGKNSEGQGQIHKIWLNFQCAITC